MLWLQTTATTEPGGAASGGSVHFGIVIVAVILCALLVARSWRRTSGHQQDDGQPRGPRRSPWD